MSNNIGRTEVSAAQDQKTVTINTSDGRLDGKITDPFVADFTSGNVVLTSDNFQINAFLQATNVTVARDLTLPNEIGLLVIDNSTGTAAVSVKRGTGTVVIDAAEVRTVYLQGGVNDILGIGVSASAVDGSGVLFSQTADAVVANTTTETTIFGTGAGSLVIPANTLAVGDQIEIGLQGLISDVGNPNFTMRIKVNGVEQATTGPEQLGSVSGDHWRTTVTMVVRTIGVSGTALIIGQFVDDQNDHFGIVDGVDFTFDTTGPNTMDATAEWAVAAGGNTVTTRQAVMSLLKAP